MLGIYCRTSKARKEKYTIEVQKEKGVKFAKSLGLPYKIYVDVDATEEKNNGKNQYRCASRSWEINQTRTIS